MRIRVMTYNVHGCVGLDLRRSERRVAEFIQRFSPDIIGIQELDLGRRRSKGVDQARLIAEHLGYVSRFHPAMIKLDEHYGDAILSRFPITLRRCGELPSGCATFICREQRAAMWAEIETGAGNVHVINTHFGLGTRERLEQARSLSEWIKAVPEDVPLIVLGDFNSGPGSAAYKVLAESLTDVRSHGGPAATLNTYPTFAASLRIDHIFFNEHLELVDTFVPRTLAGRIVSDRFPILADLQVRFASKASVQAA
jgi:endonuclease/exonuclease/phosphatase family metal-dependent hydrolase